MGIFLQRVPSVRGEPPDHCEASGFLWDRWAVLGGKVSPTGVGPRRAWLGEVTRFFLLRNPVGLHLKGIVMRGSRSGGAHGGALTPGPGESGRWKGRW